MTKFIILLSLFASASVFGQWYPLTPLAEGTPTCDDCSADDFRGGGKKAFWKSGCTGIEAQASGSGTVELWWCRQGTMSLLGSFEAGTVACFPVRLLTGCIVAVAPAATSVELQCVDVPCPVVPGVGPGVGGDVDLTDLCAKIDALLESMNGTSTVQNVVSASFTDCDGTCFLALKDPNGISFCTLDNSPYVPSPEFLKNEDCPPTVIAMDDLDVVPFECEILDCWETAKSNDLVEIDLLMQELAALSNVCEKLDGIGDTLADGLAITNGLIITSLPPVVIDGPVTVTGKVEIVGQPLAVTGKVEVCTDDPLAVTGTVDVASLPPITGKVTVCVDEPLPVHITGVVTTTHDGIQTVVVTQADGDCLVATNKGPVDLSDITNHCLIVSNKNPACDYEVLEYCQTFVEGGIDNTFMRRQGGTISIAFSDGTVNSFVNTSKPNWTAQVNETATGLSGIMPWAQVVTAFCQIPGSNPPVGCGGVPAPDVVLADMYYRYVGFRVCPGDPVPVAGTFTSGKYVRDLVIQAIQTPVVYVKHHVSCDDACDSFWTDADGDVITEVPICINACGAVPELPAATCPKQVVFGCDDVASTNASDWVSIIGYFDTCDATWTYQLDDGAGTLSDYPLVGGFVDCDSGDLIPDAGDPVLALLQSILDKTCNKLPVTHVYANGTGSVPAGLKSVTINNISGITTINGGFQLGTGRRVDSISYNATESDCVTGLLPAFALAGGNFQWTGLRPVE